MKHYLLGVFFFFTILFCTTTISAQAISEGDTDHVQKSKTDVILPIANGKRKFLGNIYSSSQLQEFTQYWNQVTPENAGKWGSVERTRDVMNWADLDKAYKLAKDNGFPFKFHVLIWGNQQPEWIKTLPADEQLEEIEEWFEAIATRYPDIDQIEVVNEPLHDPPSKNDSGGGNYINALGGASNSGWDWVINSFKLARDYFPNTKLMLNDFSIVNDGNATTKYIKIINLLKNDSLIDFVGIQGHAFSTTGSESTMKTNLKRLTDLGLPVYVTELDIDGPTDQKQLDEYKRIFPIFWEDKGVYGITLWGFRSGMWRTTEKAYLINLDGTERPALVWLREYVESSLVDVKKLESNPKISIYPNPANQDFVTFDGLENINSIQLYDNYGRKLKTQDINDETALVYDLSDIKPGIYVIQFIQKNKSYFRKFVVE